MFSLAAIQAILLSQGIEVKFSSRPVDGIMIYSLATPQATDVYREVANSRTRSIFIAGGPHPSARAAEALEHFDFVVIGEGEETLPELILALRGCGDVDEVRGIAFRNPDGIRKTDPRPHVDLDAYPPFIENLRAPIEISRGCPYNCKYCQTPRLFGTKMRHRSAATIVFYSNYLSDIRFISPNAFAYGSDGRHTALHASTSSSRRCVAGCILALSHQKCGQNLLQMSFLRSSRSTAQILQSTSEHSREAMLY
jgi:radical SAM superfamily enzyme YgiQ (UPF0313 family)